ncbi:MAG: ATP-binding domain-containing protein [Candidatus Competibacteraceae bacterium]|nr:ATP-binding domain-containing protein [Candidatus Competibacteraceae bacterium]
MEFDQVFVLGGWQQQREEDPEAERRLFYVALTRARQGLWLLELRDASHPHLERLRGDFRLERAAVELPSLPPQIRRRRFGILGLRDLFISYAGRQAPDHPLHTALQVLKPGDGVELAAEGSGVAVRSGGITVARLSQSGRQRWMPYLDRVERATVLAMVQRRAGDESVEYRNRLRVEHWEVPVLEVVYQGGSNQ